MKTIIIIFLCSLLFACANFSSENQSAAACDVQLGLGYLEVGDIDRAYHKLQLAVKAAPHSANSLSAMAFYYEKLNEEKLANEWYQRALLNAPGGQVYNNYGVFLCKHQHYHEAMNQFNLALKDHDYVAYKVYVNAGMCALANHDSATAKLLLEKALSYQPNSPEVREALKDQPPNAGSLRNV